MNSQTTINTLTDLVKKLRFNSLPVFDYVLNDTAVTDNFKDYTNPNAVRDICVRQREILDKAEPDYTKDVDRYKMCLCSFDFFEWLIDSMKYLLSFNSYTIDYHDSMLHLLRTLRNFCANQFYALCIYTFIHHGHRIVNLDELRTKTDYIVRGCAKKLFDQKALSISSRLDEIVEDMISGPRGSIYRPPQATLPQAHPGVLTLGSIFASVNSMDSDFEAAQTILTFAHTVGINRANMMFDIFRVGPLMQLKEEHPGRRALFDVFTFLRTPNLIRVLIAKFDVQKSDVLEALWKFNGLTSLLNNLDKTLNCDVVENLLKKLVKYEVLTEDDAKELHQNRLETANFKPGGKGRTLTQKIQRAQKIANLMCLSMKKNDDTFLIAADKYLIVTDGTSELVFAVLAATGELRDVALKLARINYKAQSFSEDSPKLRDSRILAFDVTFLLLARIKYMFGDVRITLSDPELETESKFFTWWDAYECALVQMSPMSSVGDPKKDCARQFQMLKQRLPFWNETDDFCNILDRIPGIGELMEDDLTRGYIIGNDIQNCLQPFRSAPCLLVCLVQWLETLPKTPIELMRNISIVLKQFTKSFGNHVAYAATVIESAVEQMLQHKQKDLHYTWVVTSSRRMLPSLRYLEVPDEQMLKEAYIYANQQGWASPDVIALIANCTRCGNYNKWTLCWLQQVTKSCCADEVLAATELILAIAFISPTPVLTELNQNLLDRVMPYQHNNYRVAQSTFQAFAWMLVRIMLLLIYTEGLRRDKEGIKQAVREAGNQKQNAETVEIVNCAETVEPCPTEAKPVENPSDETDQPNTEGEPPNKRMKLENVESNELEFSTETTPEFKIALEEGLFNDDPGEEPSLELDPQPYPSGDYWPFPPKIYSLYPSRGVFKLEKDTVVSDTLALTMIRFAKQLKVPSLRPTLTFIAYFVQQLSRVPRSRFSYRLNTVLVEPQSILSLIRTEPFAVSLDEMLRLYDIREPEQLEYIVYFACMLRKFGAI